MRYKGNYYQEDSMRKWSLTETEINERLVAHYGKTMQEMLRNPSYNIGPVLDWLKRMSAKLPRREYGRMQALIERMILR